MNATGPIILSIKVKGARLLLGRDSIAQLLRGIPPLVEEFLCLEDQLQPHGFDLTLGSVSRLETPGIMGREAAQREVSRLEPVTFDDQGWVELGPGQYLITFSEIVSLPVGLAALGRPRSSLLRSGVSIHTGVWDAGYSGRSQSLMVVHNPGGFRVQQGARVVQLVFFRLEGDPTEGYRGRYQGENL